VPNKPADLSLFLDILLKLEALDIPYVIIGGFAANIYGIMRATYDIDIIVDLNEADIQALAQVYPLPRYYADPYQMSNAMRIGSSFNIIDVDQGQKADLFPITMDPRYRPAFENRVRQMIELPEIGPLPVWAARPEDVIIGKLMALSELSSDRHEFDIYELMVSHYLGKLSGMTPPFDEQYIDVQAIRIGTEVATFWQQLKASAKQEAEKKRS
jgi:hypothetical protein